MLNHGQSPMNSRRPIMRQPHSIGTRYTGNRSGHRTAHRSLMLAAWRFGQSPEILASQSGFASDPLSLPGGINAPVGPASRKKFTSSRGGDVGRQAEAEPAPSPRSSSWPSISRLRRPNVVVNALAYDTEYASVRAKYAEPPREKAATCRRSRQRNADLVSPSV